MAAPSMDIYVNGTYVTTTNGNVDVVSSGLSVSGSMIWTYSGDGTFQGVEVTGKVWSPGTYLIGTSFSADSSGGRVDCTVIAQTPSKEYKYYPKADLTAIADAIRSVKGTSTTYTIDQMIETLAGGGKVTDLSGTTWYFNKTVDTYSQSFSLTLANGTQVNVIPGGIMFRTGGFPPTPIEVYTSDAWIDESYRTWTNITTSITDTNIIDWFYENATLQS